MKTMSYNILCAGSPPRRYWTARKELVARMIRDAAPDTFGLQEAHDRWMSYLVSALPEYAYVGIGRDNGKRMGEYSPVFYRKDRFRLLEEGHFWLSETPGIVSFGWDAACRRICSYALLEETATGKKLAHFNTHLDHIGVKAQLEGARLVASQARKFTGIPTILTGDFNVFPYSEPYMAVIESGFTDARKQAALSTDQFTFHNFGEPLDGAERRETIDYIFTRNIETVSSFTVLTDRPDGKYPSDHDPVVAEFEL